MPWQNEGGADVSLQLRTNQSGSTMQNTEIINIQNQFYSMKTRQINKSLKTLPIIFKKPSIK